jgi:hypothetical protein
LASSCTTQTQRNSDPITSRLFHAVIGSKLATITASIYSLKIVSTSSVHHVPDHRKSVQRFRFAATSYFRRNEFIKHLFPQQSSHPFQLPVPRPKTSRLLLLMRLKRPKRRVTTGRYGSIQQMGPPIPDTDNIVTSTTKTQNYSN